MRNDVRPLITALAATFAIAAMPTAAAQIYKWTNDDGTTTYSNAPPAERASAPDLSVIVPEVPRVEVKASPPSAIPDSTPKVVESAPKPETDTPRAAGARSLLPQAVQDPCLRSSDRLCHQKYSSHYRPYVGYTSEPRVAETTAVVPPARGATASAGAGGAVSGGNRLKRD